MRGSYNPKPIIIFVFILITTTLVIDETHVKYTKTTSYICYGNCYKRYPSTPYIYNSYVDYHDKIEKCVSLCKIMMNNRYDIL